MTNILEMNGITKRFPGGVVANDHITLQVREQEIHGLLGENGAGKSTLMKILYGLYDADEGEMRLRNNQVEINSPRDAINEGIGMVHQHFMLVPEQSVLENIILGRREGRVPVSQSGTDAGKTSRLFGKIANLLTLDRKKPREQIESLLEEYGMDIDVDEPVRNLDIGERQRVEIIKSLYWDADLLVLDEPTAVLTPTEVDNLFQTLRRLVADGLTVIIITHKLDEIKKLTDQVTVLRDGEVVDTVPTDSASPSQLAEMMVGREVLFELDPAPSNIGSPILEVSDLCADNDQEIEAVSDVSFEIREGEILGIAGVSGNGQTELAECLVGMCDPTIGTIRIDGDQMNGSSPREFVDAGVSYVPEDRLRYGCAPDLDLVKNGILKDYRRSDFDRTSLGFLDWDKCRSYTEELVGQFDVRNGSLDMKSKNLSGGNLQKLIVGREIKRNPKLLIANQPTRGVDVGAIEYIQEILLEQRNEGTGILLTSEELDEVLQLSDRILIMYEGEIVYETTADDVDRDRISEYMLNGQQQEA
jgi:simple sugar transport system ATP-binding protein